MGSARCRQCKADTLEDKACVPATHREVGSWQVVIEAADAAAAHETRRHRSSGGRPRRRRSRRLLCWRLVWHRLRRLLRRLLGHRLLFQRLQSSLPGCSNPHRRRRRRRLYGRRVLAAEPRCPGRVLGVCEVRLEVRGVGELLAAVVADPLYDVLPLGTLGFVLGALHTWAACDQGTERRSQNGQAPSQKELPARMTALHPAMETTKCNHSCSP